MASGEDHNIVAHPFRWFRVAVLNPCHAIHPFESDPSRTFNRPHADVVCPGPAIRMRDASISPSGPNFAGNAGLTGVAVRRVTALSHLHAAVYWAHCYRRAS
jgi:hypothetical protein